MTPPARHTRLRHQVGSFAVIGVASTLAAVVLFYALNLVLDTQLANALALVLTTVVNTAANRRYTFGVRTRAGAGAAQLQGLVLWLVMWGATATALWLLARFAPHASHLAQSAVQLAGNAVATLIRFVMLRHWFAQRPARDAQRPPERARAGQSA